MMFYSWYNFLVSVIVLNAKQDKTDYDQSGKKFPEED